MTASPGDGRFHAPSSTPWGLGLLMVGIVLILAVPATLASPPLRASVASATVASTNPNGCPFVTTESASARNVALAAPTFPLSIGDVLSVAYEFEIVNSTIHPINLTLAVPSFFAKFPLSNGTDLTSYQPPRSLPVPESSWTNASLATKTKTMTSPENFSGASAKMTSELVAVMGNATYQTVTLAFRWDWSVTFASNGTNTASPWSRVVTGGAHPTTFYPAPTVELSSTGNKTVAIGATFSAYLTGATSQTEFHSVLEYAATGNVMRNTATVTPVGNGSPVLVAVQILPTKGALAPAALLDHVRNNCGALLFSISVKAVYAASANVTLKVLPSTCGLDDFNGTTYSNGGLAVVVPSSTLIPLAAGTCGNATFLGWNTSGGVSLTSDAAASTTATVSASGTVTARFS